MRMQTETQGRGHKERSLGRFIGPEQPCWPSKMAVHESLKLHITNDKFLIESTDTGVTEVLVIDRVSQEISLQTNGQIPASAISKEICGIFGIIRLIAGPYLVVVTKKKKAGEINGQAIWEVAGTEVLSYKRTMLHLNEAQMTHNKQYLSMLDQVLGLEGYYFSTTFDLTHTMQRLDNTSPDFVQMALHERADPRFVWNGHLLRELAQQPELAHFCLPIMIGFVSVKQCTIKGKTFKYILISRRSCFRAGVRYYMRGVDSEGQVANYVETEQIVEYEGNRASFVQTRGSVPLFWSQRPNLKYKPDPLLHEGMNHVDGFQRHFAAQIYNYGSQVLINLLDHKGLEKVLVQNFAKAVESANNSQIRYEPFDFHRECGKMRWHRLSILTDRLADDQAKFGYFMMGKDGMAVCNQEGVFRTNCIDCLDRTNVVQSLFGRKSLQAQLIRLGILQVGEQVENQTHFEFIFKNVWADNADACAKQYAGTGALKTDYTRTGKRTIWGLLKDGANASYRYLVNNFQDGFRQCFGLPRMFYRTGARTKWGLLKDGYNSAIRYFMNNFVDGFRQDAVDLVLGNHIVEEAEGITKPSPLKQERDWKFYALPTIFIVAFSMALISILIPDEHPSEQIMYILFWGISSLISLGAIYLYGNDFVNKPRLAQAKTKTE